MSFAICGRKRNAALTRPSGAPKRPSRSWPACAGSSTGRGNHRSVLLTEAGTKRRASLHVVQGQDQLAAHQPCGLEVLDASLADFRAVLRRENHTLKRALTDPQLFSGIGNAYSDEILHRAHLSPLTW